MNHNTMNYRNCLIKDAHLLSLTKRDCDLFLIAQTNTITYQQLEESQLHGMTNTSGRLSLKKLEKDAYITSKTLPETSRTKYYILTAKGKRRLARLFSAQYLQNMQIDLERRPPTSQAQLPHRIRTNDLFYSFLSCTTLNNVPIWRLEAGLEEANTNRKEPSPRCDSLLITNSCSYYIEQDNCTQGDAALDNKLQQYLASNLFLGELLLKNLLIFTLHAEGKEKPTGKAPYSVYRILLKGTKIWKLAEEELQRPLSFSAFCHSISYNLFAGASLITPAEKNILSNLGQMHPDMTRKEALILKTNFLYDHSLEEAQKEEQDVIFQKRLRRKFYRILDHGNATLLHRLRQGLQIFIIPNHRLKVHLPFIIREEYQLQDFFLRLLFFLGLDIEAWCYHKFYRLEPTSGATVLFTNAFTSGNSRIIFEDVCNNLGGRERIRYFLHQNKSSCCILFILLVYQEEDAEYFLKNENILDVYNKNSNISICFLNKSTYFSEQPAQLYYWKNESFVFAAIDYDGFTNEIHLIDRR